MDPLTRRILEFIAEEPYGDFAVGIENIYERFGEDRKEVIDECLTKLIKLGEIYEPRAGYWRTI